ncbi:MAG: TetR/AcrR family transcriptional regulator [Hyphomonadaceae bacterium]|nr:TetR/AcrR family transcriptional regulator [Hyphomonadaceae bacterium]
MSRPPNPELAQRRRREILDAAEICFRRRGFHQATMQEICAEARISPGALYRYFDSKADIIAAIAEEKHREAEEAFKIARRQGGFVEALALVVAQHLDKISSETEGALFCDIMGEATRDPLLAQRLAEIDAASVESFALAIAEAQREGEIDADLDALEAAQMLMAALDGIGMRASLQGAPSATLLSQFRTLAHRYLAPAARAPTYPRATPVRAAMRDP